MKEIKITTILLTDSLLEREIPSFRGAVIALSGNNPLYHNHKEDEGYQFSYPKIQYKVIGGSPAIIGIEEGADSLGSLFRQGQEYEMQIGRDLRKYAVSAKSTSYFLADESSREIRRYQIRNWVPFNRDNYQAWLQATSLFDKIFLLDSILRGNILTLYKSFHEFFSREIHAALIDIGPERAVTYKGAKLLAFDISIETDAALPLHCGIGKGVSHGFGVVETYAGDN